MCTDSIEISNLSILGKNGGILVTGKKMEFKTMEEWWLYLSGIILLKVYINLLKLFILKCTLMTKLSLL